MGKHGADRVCTFMSEAVLVLWTHSTASRLSLDPCIAIPTAQLCDGLRPPIFLF